MSLNLGFGKDKSKTSFTQTQNSTTQQKASQKGSTVATTLDAGTIQTLQNVIGALSGQFAEGSADANAIRQMTGQLQSILSPADVQANLEATKREAAQAFNLNQGAQFSQLDQIIGSSGNSYGQLIRQQGQADFATQLAKQLSDITLGAKGMQAQNLQAAIGGQAEASQVESAPLLRLLQAVSSLTGARTTQDTSQTSLMDQISNILTQGTSKTTGAKFGFGIASDQ